MWKLQEFADEFKRLVAQNESAPLSQLIERARATVDEVKPTNQVAPKNVADATSKLLEIIPADKFISEEKILDRLDDIEPNELPEIMLTLQTQGLVEEKVGSYKGATTAPAAPQPTSPAEIRRNTAEVITGSRTAHQIQ